MAPQQKESIKEEASSSRLPPTEMEGFFFLSPSARTALPNYKYAGEDKSLLYKFVLSPLAGFLVENVTPRTVAPNAVTLFGLGFMIFSYLVFWYFAPELVSDDPLPAWIFALHCGSMLIYQTLDNMDGKQARRTGSASPLGLIWDHGLDAINSIFGSANWIISIGLVLSDDAWWVWAVVIGPMFIFYVSTWEEYYTGKLVLPLVNGPNEGLMLGALTSLTTAFLGVSFWQSTSWFDAFVDPHVVPLLPSFCTAWIPQAGLRNADIQVIASCIGFVQETLLKCIPVARKYGIVSLRDLLPLAALTVLTFWIGAVDENIWIRMPRTSLHLCSGLFVEMVSQLMIDHTTKQRYQAFRWSLLPLLVLAIMVVSGQWEASEMTDDYLLIYTSSLWACLATKMTILVGEICTVLNIWCFDIVTPRTAHERKMK